LVFAERNCFAPAPKSDPELFTDAKPPVPFLLLPNFEPEKPRDFFLNRPAELFLAPVNLDWDSTFVEPLRLEMPENPPNLAECLVRFVPLFDPLGGKLLLVGVAAKTPPI